MLLAWLVLALLVRTEAAKILVLIPTPAYSHAKFASVIYKQLARNGHEVTAFVTSQHSSNETNLQEFLLNPPTYQTNIDEIKSNRFVIHFALQQYISQLCDVVYSDPEMRKVLLDGKFDLVMIEWNVVPCFSVLKVHFNATLIGLRSLGLRLEGHDFIGNPTNPSYIPMAYSEYYRNFYGRFIQLLFSVYWRAEYNFLTVPKIQKIVNRIFPHIKGSVLDFEKSVDLVLSNTNYIINGVRPIVPANIEVGLIHLPDDNKHLQLTKEVKMFLEDNINGFIFFNLGSLIKSGWLDNETLTTIIESFRKLPYNFLWKYDNGILSNLPDNIKTINWVPQIHVLSHPNIKCFITHGGLLSLQEAIYYKVPVLVTPLLFDQPHNAFRVEELQIGKRLDLHDLNQRQFKYSIRRVIEDERYKTNMAKLSQLIKDQPINPLDKAVWWVEYVLRHRGAPFNKSNAVHMNWIVYLNFDILALMFTIASIAVIIAKYLLSTRNVNKNKID